MRARPATLDRNDRGGVAEAARLLGASEGGGAAEAEALAR